MNRIPSFWHLWTALLAFSFSLPLQAQKARSEDVYQVEAFSTRDGLIQSQVRAIMQDSRGYLWFGTHRGVSRFDGQLFTNYEPDSKDSTTLTGNFVSDIIEDQAGRIWFATDLGVSYFDGVHFHNYVTEDSLDKVLSVLEESPGHLWFGTQYRGLTSFEYTFTKGKIEGKFSHKPVQWNDAENLKRTVQAMLKDRQGRTWLGRDVGLFQADKNGTIIQRFRDSLPENVRIHHLMEDLDGHLWIGTDQGLFYVDGPHIKSYTRDSGLPDPSVFCITQDREGVIWLGTGQGIARLVGEQILPFRKESNGIGEAIDYSIRSCLTDNEGNLWFGTEGGGVLKVTRGVFVTYGEDQGLSSNLAKSFLEDAQGNIWISTYGKGISVFDGESFVRYYGEKDGLGGNDIGFSFSDRAGDFWFTSYTQGLTRYSKGRFTRFQAGDGLASNQTFCLEEDQQGRLWVGTDFGISVMEEGRFVRHFTAQKKEEKAAKGPIDNTVYFIREIKNGDVWIGSPNGLSIYHPKADTFENLDSVGKNLISINQDSKGRVWLASSTGLVLYDGQRFRKLQIEANAGANNVVAMVFAGETFLWLGTEAGVYRLDLAHFDKTGETLFDHFTHTDGLPSHETNANAAFRDSKGFVWFGTIEGAVRCPEQVKLRKVDSPPRVNLTEVRSSRGQDWEAMGAQVNPSTWLPEGLTIPFVNNRISFEYTGISLTNPLSVRYQYRLQGLDDEWSGVTRTNNAAYANLSPGPYTFQVKASHDPDKWNVPVASISFEVLPAFWQTWWFSVLMALLLGLIAYLIYRYVAARALRKREEERMKYKAEKLALEHQALYAMMNPHFTFNALQSIQYFILRQDKMAANKFLSRFAKLVRKNLESTQSEFISLAEEIERLDLYLSLEQMRFQEKFTYEIHIAPSLDANETLLPPMILQPFVENSIKHGIMALETGGRIEVDVRPQDEDHLCITITDNGIGFEASKARKANRPSEHVSKGMQITRDRLALFGKMTGKGHAVEIEEVKDEEGNVSGTRVRMLLPLHGD